MPINNILHHQKTAKLTTDKSSSVQACSVRSTLKMFAEFTTFISPSNGIIFGSRRGSICSGCMHVRERRRERRHALVHECLTYSQRASPASLWNTFLLAHLKATVITVTRRDSSVGSTVNKRISKWLDFKIGCGALRAQCTTHYSAWIL